MENYNAIEPTEEDIKKLLDCYLSFLNLNTFNTFRISNQKGRVFHISQEVFKSVIEELDEHGKADLLKIIGSISGKQIKTALKEFIRVNLIDENNPTLERKFGLAFAPFNVEDSEDSVIAFFYKLEFDEYKDALLVGEPVVNNYIEEEIKKYKGEEYSIKKFLKKSNDMLEVLDIMLNIFEILGIIQLTPSTNLTIKLVFSSSSVLKLTKLIKGSQSTTDKDLSGSIFVFWYTDDVFTQRLRKDLERIKDSLGQKEIEEKLKKLWQKQVPAMADMDTFREYQLSFLEHELTESQKKAYRRILAQDITAIEGPPGTGKTQLIATYCMDMLIHGKNVILTSTNNKAVDNIVNKLEKFDEYMSNKLLTGRYLKGYMKYTSGSVLAEYIEKEILSAQHTQEEVKQNIKILEEQIAKLKSIIYNINRLTSLKEFIEKIINDMALTRENINLLSKELFLSTNKADIFNKDNLLTFSKLFLRLNRYYAYLPVISFFIKRSFFSYASEKGIKVLGQSDAKYLSCRDIYTRNMKIYERLNEFLEFKDKLEDQEQEKAKITSEMEILNAEINKLCVELGLSEDECLKEAKKLLLIRTKELNYWKLQADKEFKEKLMNAITEIEKERLWSYTDQILKISPIIAVTALSSPKVAPPKVDLFDTAIVDEGGQTLFVYTLPVYLRAKKFVIVGDKHQLGPVISYGGNKIDKICSGLPTHLHFTKSATDTVEYIDDTKDEERRLREHFRCHRDIIEFCDVLCEYNLDIKTRTETYGFIESLPEELKHFFEKAVTFVNIEGNEEKDTFGSKKNRKEAEFIVSLLRKLKDYIPASDLGIITPYRAQSEYIRTMLRDFNNKPQVGTVHVLQGDERDIVIISAVCTSGKTLKTSRLLNNKNLINVAVSRARKHLILVGKRNAFEEIRREDSPIAMLYRYVLDRGKLID